MARAMGSLSSFGQSMSSVAHNLTGNFRSVCTLLYERVDLCLSGFNNQHRVGLVVCISRRVQHKV